MEELGSVVGELARLAPQAAQDTVGVLADTAAAFCDACEKQGAEAAHQLVERAKENPAKALMVVAGAVMMAWWLFGGRRQS